ncbi:MAG: 50S ribosomal protein L22 [Candidatus Omnitrophota bacterium]
MLAIAEAKYIKAPASKTRLVLRLIKGKTVEEANSILNSVNKSACLYIKKVLNSAFSNANFNRQDKLLAKDVIISQIKADEGPMFKRFRAATMGRAAAIRHRTVHISVELERK